MTILQLIPQLIKTVRTNKINDVAFGTLLIMFTGATLWLFSGIITRDPALIIANGVNVITSGLLLLYKFHASRT